MCRKNTTARFEECDEGDVYHSLEAAGLIQSSSGWWLDWEGNKGLSSSLGQVSAPEADDRVPFFGANSVIKAVCCRGDLIGSLSPLDVVPVGHAQWHSVLVIIFIAATALAVGGSALRARWPSTMAPSMVVLRARPVARNSRSPGRCVSHPSHFPLLRPNRPPDSIRARCWIQVHSSRITPHSTLFPTPTTLTMATIPRMLRYVSPSPLSDTRDVLITSMRDSMSTSPFHPRSLPRICGGLALFLPRSTLMVTTTLNPVLPRWTMTMTTRAAVLHRSQMT